MQRFILLAVLAGLPLSLHAQAPLVTLKSPTQHGTSGELMLIKLPSGTVVNVAAGDLKGDALQTKAVEQTCIAAAQVTLASGTQITVPLVDMVEGAKIGQRAAAECRFGVAAPAGVVTSSGGGGLPSDQAALTQIRKQCAADWPNDFTMRNFCEEQQLKALEKLRQR
jgi:hypothetical protein